MDGPALQDNDVLDSGLFTVILRASAAYGSPQFWAAVVTFTDLRLLRQMIAAGENEGKFFFVERINREGVNILWADALRCLKFDVDEDYNTVLHKAEVTGLAPSPRAQLVVRGVMTCRDWIVHLVCERYLSPNAMLLSADIPGEVDEVGGMYQQQFDENLMALGAALLRVVRMVEYNGV